ncbi:hypothetical protein HID58_095289 [Brassica napus]|uniref:Uncharacterized protein n=3 Tax=Brassica TaxID=3705 RepID=A0ABQ7X458_BRANA|nr:hypothetical protein HID58_095289 [Brassica napus]
MYFNDISPGRSESQLRFQLIHFGEARNIAKAGAFLGLELILIDEQGTVMQGFISSNRAETYRPHLKAGATYTLQIFFATRSKEIYRSLTISFSNGSVLAPLDDDEIPIYVSFPADRFRFHTHEDSKLTVDSGATSTISLLIFKNNVVDVVGHLRLVNGQSLIDRPVLDEAEIISMRHVLWTLKTLPLFFWSHYEPKNYSSSMSSSRVFIDKDIQPTIDYFNWLTSNPEIENRVNADEVTRVETMTIGQIFAYIKQEYAKEASFNCIATIDDVERDSAWYYIACSGCQTKATRELGAGHQMPAPQALIDTIGQTHKFRVKVSNLNFSGKIQAITVTKVVSPEILPPVPTQTEIPLDAEDEVALATASVVAGSGINADDGNESSSKRDESQETKRPKHGN